MKWWDINVEWRVDDRHFGQMMAISGEFSHALEAVQEKHGERENILNLTIRQVPYEEIAFLFEDV